jgi:hypothetical protein
LAHAAAGRRWLSTIVIIIVDTSVFLNVLDIPVFNQKRDRVLKELEAFAPPAANYLFLPLATVIETGNHVAQISDGRNRRRFAQKFVAQVRAAMMGKAPWQLTAFPSAQDIGEWLDTFPDCAMRGASFGDLSIIQDWHKQCSLHPRQRVLIWALDGHLEGYDRRP